MILKYQKTDNLHTLKLSGQFEQKDPERLQNLLKKLLQVRPGEIIHLTLDCGELSEFDLELV